LERRRIGRDFSSALRKGNLRTGTSSCPV